MKYLLLILSMIVGYIVAELVFLFILEPLSLGPRPVIAAVNVAVLVFICGFGVAKALKLI